MEASAGVKLKSGFFAILIDHLIQEMAATTY